MKSTNTLILQHMVLQMELCVCITELCSYYLTLRIQPLLITNFRFMVKINTKFIQVDFIEKKSSFKDDLYLHFSLWWQ